MQAIDLKRIFGRSNRHIVSSWRTLVLARRELAHRSARTSNKFHVPTTEKDISTALRGLHQKGHIGILCGSPSIFVLDDFSSSHGLEYEAEIVMELNPYAAFSHETSLWLQGFHMVSEAEVEINIDISSDMLGGNIPIDTQSRDWQQIRMPFGRAASSPTLRKINTRIVSPCDLQSSIEVRPTDIPFRVTTVEQSLVDLIRDRSQALSVETILQTWKLVHGQMEVDKLLALADIKCSKADKMRIRYILDLLDIRREPLVQLMDIPQSGPPIVLFVNNLCERFVYDSHWNIQVNETALSFRTKDAW